ncbi:relaxase/mobilization nuclease domain-containing protein [Quadrisphaera sp. KR29]|uniref:relaxase/mobilization nuclease domain-containing protein n=1 Tax=Quadrisphaera sp. KR29 TaxID=3461391 RepID=UPI00404401DD
MIGKVVRGNDVGGLLRYLYGPGRANEHTNPHLVAAWDDGVVADGASGKHLWLKRLTALLEQPLATLDHRPSPSVWHCPLRTAPGDRALTDAEWADVAAEVLHQTGLAPRGDASGCRWVAVRHADDHIHLAVTLARQDGRRARTAHDYARLGAACRTVEERYGLTVTPARDRTAVKRPTRAESEKAARLGLSETSRQQLRHQVRRAALSTSELTTFVEQLQRAGIAVRLRHSEVDSSVVTGYAVADPAHRTSAGDLVWFGGGKLAPQLSLPRLVQSWAHGTYRSSSLGRRSRLGLVPQLRAAAATARALERGDAGAGLAAAVEGSLRVLRRAR